MNHWFPSAPIRCLDCSVAITVCAIHAPNKMTATPTSTASNKAQPEQGNHVQLNVFALEQNRWDITAGSVDASEQMRNSLARDIALTFAKTARASD